MDGMAAAAAAADPAEDVYSFPSTGGISRERERGKSKEAGSNEAQWRSCNHLSHY